ncbi:MAG: ankyrin repeat domain-containing protein [Neisseriaceae bacterium]
MFVGKTGAYRTFNMLDGIGTLNAKQISEFQKKQLTPIRGEEVPKADKLKLFEEGIEYIITSNSPIVQLLGEVLGICDTKCDAFRKLSIDNRYFSPDIITREIAYFIVLCILKDTRNSPHNFKFPLNPYIKEVVIKGGNVCFTGADYPKVRISKLRSRPDLVYFDYTSKKDKLKIAEIFSNNIHDTGKCLGEVKYWLETMSIAYSKNQHQRSQIKMQFAKSLEVIVRDGKKSLKNEIADSNICQYQKDNYGFDHLKKIFDIYPIINDLPKSLDRIIDKMIKNNLSQIYMHIIFDGHALGMIIVAKGNGLKFMLLEPNDDKFYQKGFIHIDKFNFGTYKMIWDQSDIIAKNDQNRCVLIRAYIPTYIKINQHVLDAVRENSDIQLNDEEYLKKLLMLAIINSDCGLIKKILATGIGASYIFEQGITPLIAAVRYQNIEIVKLLIENENNKNDRAKLVNMEDEQGKTALYQALLLHNVEIAKLLVENGAETNIDGEYNPYTIIQKYPYTFACIYR